MRRHAEFLAQRTGQQADLPLEVLLRRADVHVGSPDDVIASLRADALLLRATDLILQVHAVDPPHDKTLRSLELIATEVAPRPGLAAREGGRTFRQSGATRAGVSPDRGRHRGLTVEPRRDDWSFPLTLLVHRVLAEREVPMLLWVATTFGVVAQRSRGR